MEKKSMDIMLTNKENALEEHNQVSFLGAVDEKVINELISISNDRLKLAKRGEKLNEKRAKSSRHARKLVNQFANSRGIQYDVKKEAIGITKEYVVYVGNRERLKEDPTVNPEENDVVKGVLTKSEKRIYEESIKGYGYLNQQIMNYMNDLTASEAKLISFEKQLVQDKECDVENQYLLVSLIDGKVYLCQKHVEQEVVETVSEPIESEAK